MKTVYNEKLLEEIRDRLNHDKIPSKISPEWAKETLDYCLSLVENLKDENESLWFMLDEYKKSQWTKEHSEELEKSINNHLAMLKIMQLRRGKA